MARKVRIMRKRRPLLWGQTKRLFSWGDLFTNILRVIATYGGNAQKDAATVVQIENRRQDTRLKAERESYVVSQNQRLELLNIEKRLELESKYGKGKVAQMLGEPSNDHDTFDNVPHTI